ncbi:MAG: hypothetical protein QF662_09340 [Phycisphaerae bacterium]|nr:hypothetical protein [Phycisphaerae bacterium]
MRAAKKVKGSERKGKAAPVAASKDKGQANYALIESDLHTYYEGYVDYVKPASPTLRHNIKKSGRKAVVEAYVRLETLCLDTAMAFRDKDVPASEYKHLAKALAKHQKKGSRDVPIDYDSRAVAEAYEVWAKDKVEFFKGLLLANPAGNYKELIKKKYTRQEYKEYLHQHSKVRNVLYGGFAKALVGFFPKIFGPGRINTVRNKAKAFSYLRLDAIYGPKPKKDLFKSIDWGSLLRPKKKK